MQTATTTKLTDSTANDGAAGRGSGAWLKDRLTPVLVRTKLRALAAMLNYKPSLRHHLKDVHPTGMPFVFNATIEFLVGDSDTGAHAIFRDGKMRVRAGRAEAPDVTLRFRSARHLRDFFAGGDSFGMLLDNSLTIDGNLSYLLKFGHMSLAATRGNTKVPRTLPLLGSGVPDDWRALKAYRRGEPALERPAGEVEHLDDPYLSRYSLDDFPAIKRLLWGYRTARPALCSERPRLLTEFVLRQTLDGVRDEPVLRQAKGLRHILQNRRPIVRDDDLLAGTTTSQRVGVLLFPELGGTGIWPELLSVEAREQNPYTITAEDIEILNRQVFPFWMTENVREWARSQNDRPDALTLDERFVLYFLWKTQAASHTVVDVPRVLSRGLRDIQAEARRREQAADDPRQRAFYEALQVATEGVVTYAEHLAAEARRLAAAVSPDGSEVAPEAAGRRARLLEMARICDQVPAGPAETLHEALQALWILFLAQHQESMNAGLAVGRLDLWLEPYLQRDLAGVDDPAAKSARIERALELVGAFMLKLTDHLPLVPHVGNRLFGGSSENQVITLGGLTPDGKTAVNDMTWIFLKATEMMHLRDPNINARYAPGVNSAVYLRRLCEVNRLTGATPSLHNDSAMVPALVNQGFELPHARDWTATGCVEPTSCGRHFGHTNCMMLNMVAPLEMALHDGVHPVLGYRVGPQTGAPRDFATFDDFFAAYRAQLGWVIDKSVEGNNLLGRAHQQLKPTPLLSALFDGPMESGRDVIDGGARYNSSGAALVGLSDVIDSLVVIEELVFGRHEVSLEKLVAACDEDFVGHETLLAVILNKMPKFGQPNAAVDRIRREVMEFAYDRYQSRPHYRGGKYLPGYWSMSNHVAFGLLSSALPSGRRKGQAFTPGLTPSHLSRTALTEQIRAVAGLDAVKMPNNIAFNVKVVPGTNDAHRDVVDRMAAYVGAYFELGGMQMQFNVMSTETLRAAMERPEEHRDLLVRISGYNAYFVELNRDIQREIVERTEHALGG
ncbi:MAG: formate acetyltransferase [Deltaproteobacteria bacterium]|nr:formate acetyltransferase [Deltaproteobacteria bacterium]